jgi:hypothetical protein
VDFRAARSALRQEELFAPPGLTLRAIYRTVGWTDRMTGRKSRRKSVARLRELIRFELRSTSYASISPVSGLLNIVALHAEEYAIHANGLLFTPTQFAAAAKRAAADQAAANQNLQGAWSAVSRATASFAPFNPSAARTFV